MAEEEKKSFQANIAFTSGVHLILALMRLHTTLL